jgi:hypothetical protein
VEATKQLYRPGAVHAIRRSRRLSPVFVPAPAAPASRVTPTLLDSAEFYGSKAGLNLT